MDFIVFHSKWRYFRFQICKRYSLLHAVFYFPVSFISTSINPIHLSISMSLSVFFVLPEGDSGGTKENQIGYFHFSICISKSHICFFIWLLNHIQESQGPRGKYWMRLKLMTMNFPSNKINVSSLPVSVLKLLLSSIILYIILNWLKLSFYRIHS